MGFCRIARDCLYESDKDHAETGDNPRLSGDCERLFGYIMESGRQSVDCQKLPGDYQRFWKLSDSGDGHMLSGDYHRLSVDCNGFCRDWWRISEDSLEHGRDPVETARDSV